VAATATAATATAATATTATTTTRRPATMIRNALGLIKKGAASQPPQCLETGLVLDLPSPPPSRTARPEQAAQPLPQAAAARRSGFAMVSLFVVALASCATPAEAGTLETLTAGFGPENATQKAGYIAVNEKNGNDGHLFFWLFEARKAPETAPLVLWLTGGPGCSSELAVFYEQGPYRLAEDGSISTNPHSWTEIANVLFVDQPVGTGFSYADDSKAYVKTEDGVATDMWEFLQTFMKEFPQYAQLDFFVTGESYAGHYVPAISSRIIANNKKLGSGEQQIHLQGLAIGNGLVDPATQYSQYVPYAHSKGLITDKAAKSMNKTMARCVKAIEKGHTGTVTLMECNSVLAEIKAEGHNFNTYDVRIKCAKPPLCYDFSPLDTLLARDDVRAALGVSPKSKWSSCNMKVHSEMMGDWFTNLELTIPPMLEAGVRVLVYSGQEDFICNWFGGRAWVDKMEWSGAAGFSAQDWQQWTVDASNSGTYKESGPLQFLGVANAGHMVPMDQPQNALVMLHTFIEGRSLRCDGGSRRDMIGCNPNAVEPADTTTTTTTTAALITNNITSVDHGDYCFLCGEIVQFAEGKACDALLCDVVAANFGPEATKACKKFESVAGMFGDSLCGYIKKKIHAGDKADAICGDLHCDGSTPAPPPPAVHTLLADLEEQAHTGAVACSVCTEIIGYAVTNGCDEALCSSVTALCPPCGAACGVLEEAAGLFGDSFCDWVAEEVNAGSDEHAICASLDAC
jgi:serine carboxypeptidase-like clade 4